MHIAAGEGAAPVAPASLVRASDADHARLRRIRPVDPHWGLAEQAGRERVHVRRAERVRARQLKYP